jgi:hypothetical protein
MNGVEHPVGDAQLKIKGRLPRVVRPAERDRLSCLDSRTIAPDRNDNGPRCLAETTRVR